MFIELEVFLEFSSAGAKSKTLGSEGAYSFSIVGNYKHWAPPELNLLSNLPHPFNQSINFFIARVGCATNTHQTFRLQT
jgi:hypothetical protein